MKTSNIFVMAVVLLFSCGIAHAFDISADFDPVSVARVCEHWLPHLDSCGPDTSVLAVAPDNERALSLWDELGITNLCVYYRPEDFSRVAAHSFKVINSNWPEDAFKYLNAYRRSVNLAIYDPDHYNYGSGSWGDSTQSATRDVSQDLP